MASLIDESYFSANLYLAELAFPERTDYLQDIIDRYEPKILRKLLGGSLYNDFISGLAEPVVDPKWIALKDGDDGDFLGIANDTTRNSIVAYYVYYEFQIEEATQTVGIGEVVPEAENASKASPVYKAVTAWNDFIDYVREMHKFIRANAVDYPGYKWADYGAITPPDPCECNCGCETSCPDKCIPFDYKNSFGI